MVEMVCVLAMITMLSGLVILNVSGWHENRRLEDGVLQFEVMLRQLRADAANSGRCFRLSADENTRRMLVLREHEPLTQPGVFAEYTSSTWQAHVPDELVRVWRMELTGPSAYRTLAMADMEDPDKAEAQQALAPITFYPDGSSDSAKIHVLPAGRGEIDDAEPVAMPEGIEDMDDPYARVGVIELDGLNGLISSRIYTVQELLEIKEALENPPPPEPAVPDNGSGGGGGDSGGGSSSRVRDTQDKDFRQVHMP